ncbi:UNVERIFIED_CONTAM: 4-diphosphocytidyl-2C-methyl-D-erythritol synthase, putative [Hammondia hammondi]|eukprot:XP_008884875.1 4-diphosphocytidyl-2C-methyl-D-erythritol synthase, putative [Hammondia hammondi]
MTNSPLGTSKPPSFLPSSLTWMPRFRRLLLSFFLAVVLAFVSLSSWRRLVWASRFRNASSNLALLAFLLFSVSGEKEGRIRVSVSGALAQSACKQPSTLLTLNSLKPLFKRTSCNAHCLPLNSLSSAHCLFQDSPSSRTPACADVPSISLLRESRERVPGFSIHLQSGSFRGGHSHGCWFIRKCRVSSCSRREAQRSSRFSTMAHGSSRSRTLPSSPRCSSASPTTSQSLPAFFSGSTLDLRRQGVAITAGPVSCEQTELESTDKCHNPSDDFVGLHGIMACGGVGSRFGADIPKQFVSLFQGQTAAQISFQKLRRHLMRYGASSSAGTERRQSRREIDEWDEVVPRPKKRAQSFLVAVVDRERRAAVIKRPSDDDKEREHHEVPCSRTAETCTVSEQRLDDLHDHDKVQGDTSRGGSNSQRRRQVDVLFAPVGSERCESVWHGVKCLCYSLLATETMRKPRETLTPARKADTNPSSQQGKLDEERWTYGQSTARPRSLCRALASLTRSVASVIRSIFHYVSQGSSDVASNKRQTTCSSACQNDDGRQNVQVGQTIPVAAAQADEARHLLRRLAALNCDKDLVMIHDAARPCVREEDLENVTADAERFGAALLAVPAVSSIKLATAGRRDCPRPTSSFFVEEANATRRKNQTRANRSIPTDHEHVFVQRTVPRHLLWEAQTPQVIRLDLLLRGYCAFWTQLATKSHRKQQELHNALRYQSHATANCTHHEATNEEQIGVESRLPSGVNATQESPAEIPTVTDDTGLLEYLWSDGQAVDILPESDCSSNHVLSSFAAGHARGQEVVKVKVRRGDSTNIKITFPTDYTLAQLILQEQNRERPAQSK